MTGAQRTSIANILLVDDNNMGLMARKTVLQELGHRVITALNAHDALEVCGKQRFDLLITDYKMPKMNGVELIRELRKVQPQVSVILISGFTDTLGLNEANTGADVVIQKSANEVSHLVRSVNRLMRPASKKPPGSQSSPRPTGRRKQV
ncbi:MAG: response regulator [Acidobacteriota bacterium]|nr:response regulator [Acidobacteriota bacterium]